MTTNGLPADAISIVSIFEAAESAGVEISEVVGRPLGDGRLFLMDVCQIIIRAEEIAAAKGATPRRVEAVRELARVAAAAFSKRGCDMQSQIVGDMAKKSRIRHRMDELAAA